MTLPPSIFQRRLITYLVPFFLPGEADIFHAPDADIEAAKADALETLNAYGARTRAEFLNAVQIIVFSLSALDLLSGTKMLKGLSPTLQLRYRGCASNLSRMSQMNEKTLANRLKCEPANKQAPSSEAAVAEPVADVSNQEAQQVMRDMQAKVRAERERAAASRPQAAMPALSVPAGRQKGSAMFNALYNEVKTPPPHSLPQHANHALQHIAGSTGPSAAAPSTALRSE